MNENTKRFCSFNIARGWRMSGTRAYKRLNTDSLETLTIVVLTISFLLPSFAYHSKNPSILIVILQSPFVWTFNVLTHL